MIGWWNFFVSTSVRWGNIIKVYFNITGTLCKNLEYLFQFFLITYFSSGVSCHIQSGDFKPKINKETKTYHIENEDRKIRVFGKMSFCWEKVICTCSWRSAEFEYANPVAVTFLVQPYSMQMHLRFRHVDDFDQGVVTKYIVFTPQRVLLSEFIIDACEWIT